MFGLFHNLSQNKIKIIRRKKEKFWLEFVLQTKMYSAFQKNALFLILFIGYFFIEKVIVESKSCIFKASQTLSRPINAPLNNFREWFALSDMPTRLIKLNP